jgi:hypothetical protein
MTAVAPIHPLHRWCREAGRSYRPDEAAFQPRLNSGIGQHIVEHRQPRPALVPDGGQPPLHDRWRRSAESDGTVQRGSNLVPRVVGGQLDHRHPGGDARQSVDATSVDGS